MKKKFNLKIFLIIFLTILVFLYLIFFSIKKNTKTEFVGYIKERGVYYVIVTDDNDNDYLLDITNSDYNVGDRVNVVLKNVKDGNPSTGEIIQIDTLSKNLVFSITDEPNTKEETNNKVSNNTNQNNSTTNNNTITNDEQVISYLNDFSNEIDTTNNLKDTIKDKFVTIVDFLFYDGTIGDVTFNELTTSTKLKVLEIALVIDKKLENKFPNYKENISATGNRVYTNVKSRVVETYLDITTKVCENDQELCNNAKEGLSNMKESFSLTWDFIKEISGVGIEKLKSWYEVWREV